MIKLSGGSEVASLINKTEVKELNTVLTMLWDLHIARPSISELFGEDEKGILKNAPANFSWAEYYSYPLKNYPWALIRIIDETGELAAELRTKTKIDEIDQVLDRLDVPEFVDFGNGTVETKYAFIAIWYALLRSLESIQVYGRSLSRLVEDVVQGSDKALFDAVKMDHSILGNPHIQRRIAIAEMKLDKKFFSQLANSIKGRPLKYSPDLWQIRYLLSLTHEIGLLDSLTMEDAYELYCLELKVYSDKGADPAGSLWKFINRWKKDNVKPYYST